MIAIVALLLILICVSSIFYPALRKLALCLILTMLIGVVGLVALIEVVHK